MMAAAWEVAQSWMGGAAHAATGGLIAAMWQGALLSLLVALGMRLLPKTPAAVRFAIWFGVFVVIAVIPWAGLMRSAGAAQGHAAWLMLDERWCLIVAAVWGVASLVRAVTLLLAVLRVRALWKRATPLDIGQVQAVPTAEGVVRGDGFVQTMLQKQERWRRAQLCVSDEIDRPAVIGFFAPRILIPAWLVEKLSAVELEQIVLHEAGHLSRADDWMNLLQKIALVVFPLNPALAWVERRLCFERELACDERVLETTGAPKAYAACLASLAEHRLGRRGLALALGALGRESELGRRVRSILCRGERMRPRHARLLLGGAMLGLLAAAAGLERCPQVVGFASHVDEAAVISAPARGDGMREGYGYQPVVFRAPAFDTQTALMPRTRSAGREKKQALSSNQLKAATGAVGNEALQASLSGRGNVRGLDEGVGASAGRREFTASDVAFEDARMQSVAGRAEGRSVVQWVVVASWRGDDGARMVLTSVRTASPQTMTPDGTRAINDVAPQDQVLPYAAVPVRGGWLVIQL